MIFTYFRMIQKRSIYSSVYLLFTDIDKLQKKNKWNQNTKSRKYIYQFDRHRYNITEILKYYETICYVIFISSSKISIIELSSL